MIMISSSAVTVVKSRFLGKYWRSRSQSYLSLPLLTAAKLQYELNIRYLMNLSEEGISLVFRVKYTLTKPLKGNFLQRL